MFRHTASTTPAVLASQGPPDHTIDTKVLLIKLPELKELRDDGSLLVPAAKLGDETGVFSHRVDIEKARQSEENSKKYVQDRR